MSRGLPVNGTTIAIGALVFLFLQVQLFGGLHRKVAEVVVEGDKELGCHGKQRKLVDEVARLKAEVEELTVRLIESEDREATGEVPVQRGWGSERRNTVGGGGVTALEQAVGVSAERPVLSVRKPGTSNGRDTAPWHEELRCQGGDGNPPEGVVAAVVVMACNRPLYLQRTLDSIFQRHEVDSSYKKKFPLFISQDGTDALVTGAAHKYVRRGVTHLSHPWVDPAHVRSWMERPKEAIAYYRISQHYRFALGQLFECWNYPKVIILEDDMEVSVDFFDYFEALSPILEQDPTLLAVSSWNDNGQSRFVSDPEAIYRSDFFPGLGWMLRRDLWKNELVAAWPKAYWDDWVRMHDVIKGRQVIRPEVCRTFNFGEKGASHGQFYKQYLSSIRLNDVPVRWTRKDLSYMVDDAYWSFFMEILKASPHVANPEEIKMSRGDIVIEYDSHKRFDTLAQHFGIFREWKDGMPRASYRGVVIIRMGNVRVFITPANMRTPLKARSDGTRPYIGPIYSPMPPSPQPKGQYIRGPTSPFGPSAPTRRLTR